MQQQAQTVLNQRATAGIVHATRSLFPIPTCLLALFSSHYLRLIKKFSTFFPFFNAATNHLGLAPRPAQVSPDGLRYFGGTFLPLGGPLCPIFLAASTPNIES